MRVDLNLVTNLFKTTSIYSSLLTLLLFIAIALFSSFYKGYSFFVGGFLISLNIYLLGSIVKFCSSNSNQKNNILFSLFLFMIKFFLLGVVIFLFMFFELVDNVAFFQGLSLGFGALIIATVVVLPIKIYKLEKS